MKRILTIVVLVCIVALLFGCALTPADNQAAKKFSALQEKYSTKEVLTTNSSVLGDYIKELATLRGTGASDIGKVIESELYSVQAFYYLDKAMNESKKINYTTMQCASKEVRDTRAYVKLALDSHNKAIASLTQLSVEQKALLRPDQLETVSAYGITINQIKSFFDEKC